jgi:hypothetical protein
MEIQLGQLSIIGLKWVTRSRSSIDIIFGESENTKGRSTVSAALQRRGSKLSNPAGQWNGHHSAISEEGA